MRRAISPGWARMLKRLGKAGAEALRQQTLQMQDEMREKVGGERVAPRERDTYKDYPPTKARL